MAAVQTAGVVVVRAFARVARGAKVGGTVVVGIPARTFALVALTLKDADESQLELTVIARVNDGVQAAVEVAQPEDHFEEDFRRTEVHIERSYSTRPNKRRRFVRS